MPLANLLPPVVRRREGGAATSFNTRTTHNQKLL
jgi:hypothetical protein